MSRLVVPLSTAIFTAQLAGLLAAGALPITCDAIGCVLIAASGGLAAGIIDGRAAGTRLASVLVFLTLAMTLAWLTQTYVGLRGGRILLPELLIPSALAVTACMPLRVAVTRWLA